MSPLQRRIEHHEIPKQKVASTLKKQKVKKKGLYSLQGLIGISSVLDFMLLIGQLYLDAQINEIHYRVEKKKLEIDQQTVVNEELYSKISELSTYSRAMEVAKNNGLSTYENTITIGE